MPSPRHLILLLQLAALLFCAPARCAQAPPIGDFFDNPAFGAAALSPDGRHLAVVVNHSAGRDRLAVFKLATMEATVVAQFSDGDVNDFAWVNNTRLVYDSRDKHISPGTNRHAPGLYAVNLDGSGRRQLVEVRNRAVSEHTLTARMQPWNTFMLRQRGAQDSDAIYVLRPRLQTDDDNTVDLLRLDTVSGRASVVKSPGAVQRWLLDAGGEPRLAITYEAERQTIHYLDPAGGAWRTLVSQSRVAHQEGDFDPLGFGPDGTLYVTTRQGDKQVLGSYDLGARRLHPQALVQLQDYDFEGRLMVAGAKLLGVRYLSDAGATVWFDAPMKAVQEALDKLLPDTVNLIEVPTRAETPWVLVQSHSDRQPRILQLYDTASGKLTRIGASRPNIDPARMATQDLVRYQARDGLRIPAWLTVPNGGKGKQLPLVLLVHGGPFIRGGSWGWDADAQFLASRGYAVLEPEFRGSTGFGRAHFRAGWKQWGLGMQDDIADGARWAVAQGIADPARICIMGASFGGYAALMGVIRDPELYRCAINYLGVTDIELLYTGHWSANSDISEMTTRYGLPLLVGDRVKDAAQLAATSPLQQAARVTRPVLLAYGGVDRRVPAYHGRKFHDAVKATNQQVEWVVYDDEAHGWSLVGTRLDFWGRVERFLGQHIGAVK